MGNSWPDWKTGMDFLETISATETQLPLIAADDVAAAADRLSANGSKESLESKKMMH